MEKNGDSTESGAFEVYSVDCLDNSVSLIYVARQFLSKEAAIVHMLTMEEETSH